MRNKLKSPELCSLFLLTLCLLHSINSVYSYMQFEPVQVPSTEKSSEQILATLKATYGQYTKSEFQKIARSTEDHNCILPGCSLMGEVLDIRGNNVTRYDPETLKDIVEKGQRRIQFSNDPSGGILIQEEESNLWFMLYQFEKPNPGTMYRVRMRLENDTALATRLTIPVSFSAFGGLWKPRVSTLTPDNGMIGTEGRSIDAKDFYNVPCMYDTKEFDCLYDINQEMFYDVIDFMRYFVRLPQDLFKEGMLKKEPTEAIPGFKPYRYGFPYTITLSTDDDDVVLDNVRKLYAMGRVGANGIAVMQDGITVYMSGGRGGFFRFVDSGDGDFLRGELYAARITLTKAESLVEITEGTSFNMKWTYLGETDYEDIKDLVGSDSELVFRDIITYEEVKGSTCNEEYLKFVTIGDEDECISIEDEVYAAVFEPERLGAAKGATTNVFKFSEMATRLDSDKFYLAATEISSGVLEAESKTSTSADLPLTPVAANKCGCVFEVSVDENFEAFAMRAIVCGNDKEGVDERNSCNTESLANPRAMTFANRFENLLIGEDSFRHENPYVWAWDPETEQITRIFHSPREGSITSLTWFQDVVGGNNYIGVTLAHPYDTFSWLSYFGSFDLTAGEKLTFSGVSVPYAKGPKNLPTGFSRVTNGVSELTSGFTELFATGDKIQRSSNKKDKLIIGEVIDEKYKPVDIYEEGPVEPERVLTNEIRHEIAFSSLIDMCGNIYSIAVTNSLPASSYVIQYSNKKKSGLNVVSAEYVDWSVWNGLWPSGTGIVSPWNTHIGGEAFEPDGYDFIGYSCLTGFSSCFKSKASEAFDKSIQFIRYYGRYLEELENKFEKLAEVFNPYHYGYVYEIQVNDIGCVKPLKYMTLGRFSHGAIQVMPDQKTVYMTDWTEGRDVGGGLFKFIAKKASDLSEGTLYAAKFKSIVGTLERFTVSWIELGSAKNDDLVKAAKKIKFTDIFDYTPSSKSCKYSEVNIKSQVECISVKKGQEKYAAFLETRRYAALKDASIELANIKGLVYDPSSGKLFVTINRITSRDKIMLQDDITASTNDVKMPLASCGCVYSMTVLADANTKSFEVFTCGTDDFGVVGDNQCNVENVANPKDLTTIPGHRLILVAEDSCRLDVSPYRCGHVNNGIFAIDSFDNNEYTRILTVPPLSAITSTVWYPQIGSASYITVAVNEMYDEGFNMLASPDEPKAVFGIIGPLNNKEADARRTAIKEEPSKCYDNKDGYQCPNSSS